LAFIVVEELIGGMLSSLVEAGIRVGSSGIGAPSPHLFVHQFKGSFFDVVELISRGICISVWSYVSESTCNLHKWFLSLPKFALFDPGGPTVCIGFFLFWKLSRAVDLLV
jgi:hypothetical protein